MTFKFVFFVATVLVLVPILINPKWNIDADFINPQLTATLRLDAKLSLHPIEVVVPDVGQIGQIFDSLSYWCVSLSALVNLRMQLIGTDSTSYTVEV